MKNYFKPGKILFYLLSSLVFFFIGGIIVAISGVAKDQGLAAGAIVFAYSVVFSLVALVVSIIISSRVSSIFIKRSNIILTIVLILLIAGLSFRVINSSNGNSATLKSTQVFTASYKQNSKKFPIQESTIGLGLFTIDFRSTPVVYFYSLPDSEFEIQFGVPVDSVSYKIYSDGKLSLEYGPPWLYPERISWDGLTMEFRVLSVGTDYVEVISNKENQSSMFLSLASGNMRYWAEYLISLESIKFIDPGLQSVHIKPLVFSAEVKTEFEYMKPLAVRIEWMKVNLYYSNGERIGSGWVKWNDGQNLLIEF